MIWRQGRRICPLSSLMNADLKRHGTVIVQLSHWCAGCDPQIFRHARKSTKIQRPFRIANNVDGEGICACAEMVSSNCMVPAGATLRAADHMIRCTGFVPDTQVLAVSSVLTDWKPA
jgi:hypothetical protein